MNDPLKTGFLWEWKRLFAAPAFWLRLLVALAAVILLSSAYFPESGSYPRLMMGPLALPILFAVPLLVLAYQIPKRTLTNPANPPTLEVRAVKRSTLFHARALVYLVLSVSLALLSPMLLGALAWFERSQSTGQVRYVQDTDVIQTFHTKQRLNDKREIWAAGQSGYAIHHARDRGWQEACYEAVDAQAKALPPQCSSVNDAIVKAILAGNTPIVVDPRRGQCLKDLLKAKPVGKDPSDDAIGNATALPRALNYDIAINVSTSTLWIDEKFSAWLLAAGEAAPEAAKACPEILEAAASIGGARLIFVKRNSATFKPLVASGILEDRDACVARLSRQPLTPHPDCHTRSEDGYSLGWVATVQTLPPAVRLAWAIFAALFGWLLLGLASEGRPKHPLEKAILPALVIGFAILFIHADSRNWLVELGFTATFLLCAYAYARFNWLKRDLL